MKFVISDELERAAARSSDQGLAADLEYMLAQLSEESGIVCADQRHQATAFVAFARRREGLLVTLLDERERPVQMFPLGGSLLAEHLDAYAATITHLADRESLRGFEALDYGKRVTHDEAAEALTEALSPILTLDHETARNLFTLVFALLRRIAPRTSPL